MPTTCRPLLLTILIFSTALVPACASRVEESPPAVDSTGPTDFDSLRAQLLELRERDQAARAEWVALLQDAEPNATGGITMSNDAMEAMRAVHAIDAASTAFLKEVVAKHGWPTKSMVGDDGASAAWLLVQHADQDPTFQSEALALMEPLVEIGEVEPREFALLTDRVRLAQGRPQLYATQFTDDGTGALRPSPTEDWASVEARRASVGLAPLATYAEALTESYGQPVILEPMPMPIKDD